MSGGLLDERAWNRTKKAVLEVEAADLAGIRRRDGGPSRQRPAVSFGKPTAVFASGTTVTVNPTDQAGADIEGLNDVVCHLAPDASSVTAAFAVTDILRFARYPIPDANGVGGVLLGFLTGASYGDGLQGLTDYIKFGVGDYPGAGAWTWKQATTLDCRGRIATVKSCWIDNAAGAIDPQSWTGVVAMNTWEQCYGASWLPGTDEVLDTLGNGAELELMLRLGETGASFPDGVAGRPNYAAGTLYWRLSGGSPGGGYECHAKLRADLTENAASAAADPW